MKLPSHTQADPWRFALDAVRRGHRAILVYVVRHTGSVPGVTGTRIVVSDKQFAGTVGGGAAEMELLERASTHGDSSELCRFVHTPSGGGTLCSGVQDFAVLALTQSEEKVLQSMVEALENHRTGTIRLTPDGIDFTLGETQPHAFQDAGETWSYTGPVGLEDTLYIVGGGHVGLALSRVMSTLPFRIIVLDNRHNLPTMAANQWAHERYVIDFEAIADHVEEGHHSWVVIMTFGHVHDRRVLEGLLGREYAYLGVMGSKAKIKQMFAAMASDGVSNEEIDVVHAPVGISIGSHTPEEIAISVAAEIIALRNRS